MSGSPGVIKRGGNCSGTRAEPEKAEKAGKRCPGESKLCLAQGGTERQGVTEGGLMGAVCLYNS